ncbi:Dual specificity protein phosphatase 16-like [Homarus americanus]|uniref:protein-tyrosine-phosphatase n=1 Tax=Homarus americanus TaxID=6706 RepID=A0A8J5TJT2_HOMAM|nr:Dual specificity protein phosphatase 16-like [Homarus americanus]
MEAIKVVTPHKLSLLVRSDKALIIDSRTFCEFNTSHILNSINVWSSKIRKKRLQQDSISVHDYLQQACQVGELHEGLDIIVYDQNAISLTSIPQDSFLHVLLNKLGRAFPCVYLLAGGFLEFQARFPELCEDSSNKCTPLTTQSQPCLSVSNDYNILYELNVSVSCPKPDFVQDSYFMRIPVNDNFSEKLLPYFNDAFNFIDKVRESSGCVLVHCLAGISRSATVAIAYVMKHLSLPFDEAYMYVKTRRPTISPNINFVGQLAELDRQLRRDTGPRDPSSAPILYRSHESHHSSTSVSSSSTAYASSFLERHACAGGQTNMPKSLSLNLRSTLEAVPASPSSTPHTPDMSPSTALARLSFASALDELRDDGLPITPKCSSPVTPISSLPPSSPKTTVIRDTTGSPIFSFRRASESSCPSSPAFNSFYKSKEVSSRTSSDYKSEAKVTSLKESFTSSDSIKSTSGSTSNYYSSATFNVGAAEAGREKIGERGTSVVKTNRLKVEERGNASLETGRVRIEEKDSSSVETGRARVEERGGRTCGAGVARLEEKGRDEKTVRPSSSSTSSFSRRCSDRESRQVSVCVIDVKREASPVSYVRSEPLVVRETQVIATPCNAIPEVRSVFEVQIEDGKQKEEHIMIPEKTIQVLKKGSRDNQWSSLDEKHRELEESILNIERCHPQRDKVPQRPREVIVPIQLTGAREERPRVLELSVSCSHQKQLQHPATATAACTAPEPTSGVWLPVSPQEAAVAGPPAATPNSPSSPGVQQSDSGIIVEEERTQLPPNPQRLPRCYSSSETHLNTRRLLEHRNPDFTTRKCSSYDEVGRAWPHSLSPHHQQHQQGVGREGTTWLGPWELARSDSVSTSGFGSEISDTDFLHDDTHSTTTQDDALGPYDAVFADVFPGGEQPQRQPQPTTPKTPRPASLPGVTGAYFSQFEANTDPGLDMGVDMGSGGVELRRSGRGRMGVEKKDSGYYSFLTEHPPVSPRTMGEGVRHTTTVPCPKERPRDLRLQIGNIVGPPTHDTPKTTITVTHIPTHTPTGETRTSPEKRMTPEKRKSRGSSTEENEEKRRSCEADTHQWTPPRQSISIGSGVRMAQELLRGVEQLLDSEMGELRKRTAAMSSRIRLLGRSDSASDNASSISSPSSSGNSSTSGRSSSSGKGPNVHTTHIIVTTLENDEPSNVKTMRNMKPSPSQAHKYPEPAPGTLIASRARSEPPFSGEEGLYRARSCPGLPRPNGSCEGNETVSALVPDLQLVRLRGSRPQASREKFFNRYSCGALDARQPPSASAFESCPDFGNLRQCVREGDSIHSSSSSLSSTHSSFTRLLQVS